MGCAARDKVPMENAWDTAAALIHTGGDPETTARHLPALAEAVRGQIADARVSIHVRSGAKLAKRRGDATRGVAALGSDELGEDRVSA